MADSSKLTCVTPDGIVGFNSVFEPKGFPGDKKKTGEAKEPKHRLDLIFAMDVDLVTLRKIVLRAAIAKFGIDADEVKERFKSGDLAKPFHRSGPDTKYGRKYKAPYDIPGIFIRASTDKDHPPQVVDPRAKDLKRQQDFFAGCVACASVYAHAYDTMGNEGVTFYLNNVQLVEKGEKRMLSMRKAASDEFKSRGDYEDDDYDDSEDDAEDEDGEDLFGD